MNKLKFSSRCVWFLEKNRILGRFRGHAQVSAGRISYKRKLCHIHFLANSLLVVANQNVIHLLDLAFTVMVSSPVCLQKQKALGRPTTGVGKDVGKKEPLYTAGGNAN
jgi:hypothetical protein